MTCAQLLPLTSAMLLISGESMGAAAAENCVVFAWPPPRGV